MVSDTVPALPVLEPHRNRLRLFRKADAPLNTPYHRSDYSIPLELSLSGAIVTCWYSSASLHKPSPLMGR